VLYSYAQFVKYFVFTYDILYNTYLHTDAYFLNCVVHSYVKIKYFENVYDLDSGYL